MLLITSRHAIVDVCSVLVQNVFVQSRNYVLIFGDNKAKEEAGMMYMVLYHYDVLIRS